MEKNQILKMLRDARTETEWNRVCDMVKDLTRDLPSDQRSGEYPSWWFAEVVCSGLANKPLAK